jgi:hypothetical protein
LFRLGTSTAESLTDRGEKRHAAKAPRRQKSFWAGITKLTTNKIFWRHGGVAAWRSSPRPIDATVSFRSEAHCAAGSSYDL